MPLYFSALKGRILWQLRAQALKSYYLVLNLALPLTDLQNIPHCHSGWTFSFTNVEINSADFTGGCENRVLMFVKCIGDNVVSTMSFLAVIVNIVINKIYNGTTNSRFEAQVIRIGSKIPWPLPALTELEV